MNIYPESFPCPLIDGYGVNVDMGVIRTQMESGRPRQRRRYNTMPHYFQVSFAVPVSDFDSWQGWINLYAYDWMQIGLVSYLTGFTNDRISTHLARFTGDLQYSPINADVMRVNVEMELAPADMYSVPTPFTGDWIIANGPSNAATDWIIARGPSNAATDWIIAGSPFTPAAYV